MARPLRYPSAAALALIGGLSLSGCAINPATGQNQLMLVSEVQGIAMGREADPAIVASIGLMPDAGWQSYIQEFGARPLGSFQPLTDPRALGRQPQRVEIITLERSTTIEALARERPSAVTPATLALINQVDVQTPLEVGRLVKWIVGPS